jgi:hypothetical protein
MRVTNESTLLMRACTCMGAAHPSVRMPERVHLRSHGGARHSSADLCILLEDDDAGDVGRLQHGDGANGSGGGHSRGGERSNDIWSEVQSRETPRTRDRCQPPVGRICAARAGVLDTRASLFAPLFYSSALLQARGCVRCFVARACAEARRSAHLRCEAHRTSSRVSMMPHQHATIVTKIVHQHTAHCSITIRLNWHDSVVLLKSYRGCEFGAPASAAGRAYLTRARRRPRYACTTLCTHRIYERNAQRQPRVV